MGFGGYSSSSSSDGGAVLFIVVVVAVAVLAAFLAATGLFVELAEEKGYTARSKLLWFIGVFASPIVVGLYVLSLPDLRNPESRKQSAVESELPSV